MEYPSVDIFAWEKGGTVENPNQCSNENGWASTAANKDVRISSDEQNQGVQFHNGMNDNGGDNGGKITEGYAE